MAKLNPSSNRIAILERQLKSVLRIHDAVADLPYDASPFLEAELLSTLPITEAHLPFFSENNHICFEPLFLCPMERETYEALLEKTFQRPGARLRWPEAAETVYDGNAVDFSTGSSRLANAYSYAANDQLHMKVGDVLPMLLRSDWGVSSIEFKHSGHGNIECPRDNRYQQPNWLNETVYDACGVGVPLNGQDCSDMMPHMSCTLNHPVPLDDRILRSEIICLTQMIANRINYHAWASHLHVPVFCYTFNGPKVRLTQAHFDGGYLRLLRTENVEIVHSDGSPNHTTLDMLVRWLIGKPLLFNMWEEPSKDPHYQSQAQTSPVTRSNGEVVEVS